MEHVYGEESKINSRTGEFYWRDNANTSRGKKENKQTSEMCVYTRVSERAKREIQA